MLLVGSAGTVHGQAVVYTNTFDADTSVASWIYWYGLGYNNTKMTWDGTMDAQNNPNSGSLQVSLPFGSSGDQGVWFGTFDNRYGYDASVTVDGTLYSNLTVDVHVDPSAPLNSAGNFGNLLMGLVTYNWSGGGSFYGNGQTIPASATNGWFHLVQPIDQTAAGLSKVAGWNFKYTSYSGYPKAPVLMWLDNLTLNPSTSAPKAPKLVAPMTPSKGLNLFASTGSGTTGQYNRYSLSSIQNNGYTWVGAPSQVTYSVTISEFPGQAYSGFQQHIFLIPGVPGNGETAPDWNEPNVIFYTVQYVSNLTTNSGVITTNWFGAATFRYKTNQPNGNSMIFGSGTLGRVTNSTPFGQWSITFNQNTNITLTAPGGATSSFTMPPDAAALFADPLTVYVGAQPNVTNAYGQKVVLSKFEITGAMTPLSDNFLTDPALDATTWKVLADDVNGVQFVPSNSAYWIGWSIPDAHFSLQTTANLGDPKSWTSLTGTNAANPLPPIQILGNRMVLLSQTNLPSSNAGYFRLINDN